MTVQQLKEQVLFLQNHTRVLEKNNQDLKESFQGISNNYVRVEKEKQQLEKQYQQILQQNAYMSFQIDQYKRLIHGSKRERFISNEVVGQMVLPFEGTQEEVTTTPVETKKVEYTRSRYSKPHPGRAELPDHLPVTRIVLEPEEDLEGLKCIGEKVTRKLDITPASLTVIEYVRPQYVKEVAGQQQIIIADLPTFPIEKGIATAGLLAQIAVDKYVDHLPLYRQRERFKREQIDIAASTIDSWILRTAQLLSPLYEALRNKILQQGYLQVDETPIKVLDRDKKGKTHQGYYWVYHSPLQDSVFFDYQPGRGRDGPRELLKNFSGYLQSDGYGVYEWFGKQKGIVLQGCMAHARRHFEKALDYDNEKASQVLVLIQALYAVERKARENRLSASERKELRLDEALPVANELGKLMVKMIQGTLPKSPLGQALSYTIARWDNLLNYLYDGSLEIDNNLVENAIRPNALGRKNFLFAGSHEGARRSAMFYTFFGTCKMHGVNPWQWIKKVLEVIPDHHVNKLEELFPQNMSL